MGGSGSEGGGPKSSGGPPAGPGNRAGEPIVGAGSGGQPSRGGDTDKAVPGTNPGQTENGPSNHQEGGQGRSDEAARAARNAQGAAALEEAPPAEDAAEVYERLTLLGTPEYEATLNPPTVESSQDADSAVQVTSGDQTSAHEPSAEPPTNPAFVPPASLPAAEPEQTTAPEATGGSQTGTPNPEREAAATIPEAEDSTAVVPGNPSAQPASQSGPRDDSTPAAHSGQEAAPAGTSAKPPVEAQPRAPGDGGRPLAEATSGAAGSEQHMAAPGTPGEPQPNAPDAATQLQQKQAVVTALEGRHPNPPASWENMTLEQRQNHYGPDYQALRDARADVALAERLGQIDKQANDTPEQKKNNERQRVEAEAQARLSKDEAFLKLQNNVQAMERAHGFTPDMTADQVRVADQPAFAEYQRLLRSRNAQRRNAEFDIARERALQGVGADGEKGTGANKERLKDIEEKRREANVNDRLANDPKYKGYQDEAKRLQDEIGMSDKDAAYYADKDWNDLSWEERRALGGDKNKKLYNDWRYNRDMMGVIRRGHEDEEIKERAIEKRINEKGEDIPLGEKGEDEIRGVMERSRSGYEPGPGVFRRGMYGFSKWFDRHLGTRGATEDWNKARGAMQYGWSKYKWRTFLPGWMLPKGPERDDIIASRKLMWKHARHWAYNRIPRWTGNIFILGFFVLWAFQPILFGKGIEILAPFASNKG